MRQNQFIVVVGTNVILVPYEEYHVPKYHSWMNDPGLREQTASERLSLQEEYDMQRSWREDADKCTFIVLDRKVFEDWSASSETSIETSDNSTHEREVKAMIGDVNLFFIEDDDDDDDISSDALKSGNGQDNLEAGETRLKSSGSDSMNDSTNADRKRIGEVELMIAEKSFRGRGRGKEAILLMLHFGLEKLGVGKFVAKIGADNSPSQNLFQKIGFRKTKCNAVFEEVTMKADAGEETFRGIVALASDGASTMSRAELHAR